ncbi:ribonuclease H-like protein [Aulographum hederae CBS 113979]|uniref:ribonuclease H n=1 Tax=Aulographum hederae CBS 113979 TaxID=1176131 RepID=A0A6G1GZF2_9PEZI|nr:ribonuclease H-like protein [Aulographum hederae CBS 113979]
MPTYQASHSNHRIVQTSSSSARPTRPFDPASNSARLDDRAESFHIPSFSPINPSQNFIKFSPPHPDAEPEDLFCPMIAEAAGIPHPRNIRDNDDYEFLIYTDGSCLSNGRDGAQAGCAFIFRPATGPSFIPRTTFSGRSTRSMGLHALGACTFHLEARGPDGERARQTSNRAELRAVIAALQYRVWTNEGFDRLVIATDSAYAVEGATYWVNRWQRNGWQTSGRKPVLNRDLWEELLREKARWSRMGMRVLFWRIPRELNSEADELAKDGAEMEQERYWTVKEGSLC